MRKITIAKLRVGWEIPHFTQVLPPILSFPAEIGGKIITSTSTGGGLRIFYDAESKLHRKPFNRAVLRGGIIQHRIHGTLIIARQENGIYFDLTDEDRRNIQAITKEAGLIDLDLLNRTLLKEVLA